MNAAVILAIIAGVLVTLAFIAHSAVYSVYTQNWNEKPSVGAMYTRIYNDVVRGGAGRAANAKKALNKNYADSIREKYFIAKAKGPAALQAHFETFLPESSGKWTQYRRSRKHRQRI